MKNVSVQSRCPLDGSLYLSQGGEERCDFGRWASAMAQGDFEVAWRINDVTGSHWPSAHRFGNVHGLVEKSIIVRSLHGLGDTIQMLQYAMHFETLGAKAIFEVQPALLPLMRYFRGVHWATSWAFRQESFRYDRQVEIMELAYLFRTAVPHLPLETQYLDLPLQLRSSIAMAMGVRRKLRVGLLCSGGAWDPDRWISFPMLHPLLSLPEVEFWNLQANNTADYAAMGFLKDARETCGFGLLDFAGIIANLDLVITPDTFAAHLAGALGIPAWVMLRYEADWRWMRNRSDSPWYPSLRLFRQPSPGAWPTVVDNMRESLSELTRKHYTRQSITLGCAASP